MKIIQDSTNNTVKYVHRDGSETSFKSELSGQYVVDNLLSPQRVDKEKYSLVISCSAGCQLSCSFCHLTQNGKTYKRLTSAQVLQNLVHVLEDQATKQDLSNKYIKLCWMGEGEAILDPEMIRTVSTLLIKYAMECGFAKGVDGVDIATSMPKISVSKQYHVEAQLRGLKNSLDKLHRNPHNSEDRSIVRMFYSLHSAEQATRERIIPNTMPLHRATAKLERITEAVGIDLIFHYMFMEGINDDDYALNALLSFMSNRQDRQLRILRYNAGVNGLQESSNLGRNLQVLSMFVPDFKVQYSAGQSIKSACGMFYDENDV